MLKNTEDVDFQTGHISERSLKNKGESLPGLSAKDHRKRGIQAEAASFSLVGEMPAFRTDHTASPDIHNNSPSSYTGCLHVISR